MVDVKTLIPTGRKNAISSRALMNILNCNERELREIIQTSRMSDIPICSSRKKGNSGYYFHKDKAELLDSIKTLESVANNIHIALRSQRKALKEYEGQEKLEWAN